MNEDYIVGTTAFTAYSDGKMVDIAIDDSAQVVTSICLGETELIEADLKALKKFLEKLYPEYYI